LNYILGNGAFVSYYPFYPQPVEKKPYTCPVCGGNGQVPHGFYTQTSGQWSSTSSTPEQCRTCKGTGVVWG
jgi:DnaJ-class molecular chaperone